MRITTVKQIIHEADERAKALRRSGQLEAQLPVYETALSTMLLVGADDDLQPAWERLVMKLCDTQQRLVLDALDTTPLEHIRRRLLCIADIPEVTGFGSLQDIHTLIASAINVGAPRYNAGDIRGCVELYWTTAHLITDAPATRGIPGYARAIAQIKPIIDIEAPAGPFTPAAIDAFAWELRHALDATARIAV
jgi:hypothetical protein